MTLETRGRGSVLCAALCLLAVSACSPPEPVSLPDASVPPPSLDGGEPSTSPGQTHGPKLRVSPAGALNFGEVAFFGAGIDHPTTTRKLVLFNVGDAPLRIENVKLEAKTAGADDLELALPDEWPGVNIEPTAGNNHFDVELPLTPRALGKKAWTLTFESSDPDARKVSVDIEADMVTPPSCQFSVSPEKISVGLVDRPGTLSIQVTNLGTTPVQQCLLSDVQLIADPGSPFSVDPDPFPATVLAAGKNMTLQVRVTPVDPSSEGRVFKAVLQFRMTPSESPLASVQIETQKPAENCLVIAPTSLDMGGVEIGCGSATRTFNLYSTCTSTAVTLTDFKLDSSSVKAGTRACPGTTDCPEFSFVQSPSMPAGGIVLDHSTVTFQVKYRPLQVGASSGDVVLTTTEGGQMKLGTIPVNGSGVLPGNLESDQFVQSMPPQTSFPLTQTPRDASPIYVSVDGQSIASTDAAGNTVWSYDAASNAVEFEPAFAPAAGTVVISYAGGTCYP